MEPPAADVPGGREAGDIAARPGSLAGPGERAAADQVRGQAVRLAACAGALTLAALSTGDVLLLALLLGLAAADVLAGAVAGLAAVAVVARWGSGSLPALAGAQAVLGPAGLVGPWAMALSTWVAALALVAAPPARRGPGRGIAAGAAFGLAGALVVAGPSGAEPADLAVRLVAGALGVALALGVVPRLPARRRRRVALVAAGAAAALAVLA